MCWVDVVEMRLLKRLYRFSRLRGVLEGLGLFGLVPACRSSDGIKVDFNKRADIPVVRTAGEADSFSSSTGPLRVAITGLLSPTETLSGYGSFLAYLEQRLGRPVKLVQRGTYAELNALLQARQIDMAMVCPLPYIQGQRAFGMELVATAVHRGEPAHYSYLVVAAASNITSLAQLRGRTFAFSDPDSHSGWLAPAYQLALERETADKFFLSYVFTYHHSESLRAVTNHLVDGTAVDSLIYDYLSATDPDLVGKTRVIARWGPYPSPSFVVNPDLDSTLKERLRGVLLTMNQDTQGQKVLRNLGLDGFAAINDSAYDIIRSMEAKVKALATAGR